MEHMNIVGVIQVRVGSTRLKRKCFRSLGKMTILERVLLQVQGSEMIDRLVLSTSDAEEDDEIVSFASKKGIGCTRGPLNDIVRRMFNAKAATEAETLVRIWGDCPFICPKVIDRCIIRHRSKNSDLTLTVTSTNVDLSYPPGQDLEVYKGSAVEYLNRTLNATSDLRTFPRIAIYRDAEFCARIEEVKPKEIMTGSYLAVDYMKDLEFAKMLLVAINETQRPILLEEILSKIATSQDCGPLRAALDRNPEYNMFLSNLNQANS